MSEKNKNKIKDTKDNKKEEKPSRPINLFATIVIAVIIVTFVFTGGSIAGIFDFVRDIGKEKIKNEDGSISIPDDAQVKQNRNNPNTYIGRVLNEKIRWDPNSRDDFNYNLVRIFNSQEINNPMEKYQSVRYVFEQQINKIIGMHNAKKMKIIISKDYWIQEVGKRYFADSDGDVKYYDMKKDPAEVNRLGKTVIQRLLYENFLRDYFEELPISYEELWDNYKMENVKVSLKYINILNNEVDDKKLKVYFNNNKEKYKQYKLTRLVFKNKEDADNILEKLKKDPSNFIEIGNKLKTEDKIVNIKYDSEYFFIDDFEEIDLKEAVRNTPKGKVGDIVVETSLGPIIFLVDKEKYGDFHDEKIYNKLKTDYLEINYINIDTDNKKKAHEIYKYSKKYGIQKAADKFNAKIKTSPRNSFMGYNIPNVNPDETDDRNFMISIFKNNINDVLEPYKHDNGYMITMISDKTEASKDDFEDIFENLNTRNSDKKSINIREDYYNTERKKHEIIDNFYYVFNPQMFMQQEYEQ